MESTFSNYNITSCIVNSSLHRCVSVKTMTIIWNFPDKVPDRFTWLMVSVDLIHGQLAPSQNYCGRRIRLNKVSSWRLRSRREKQHQKGHYLAPKVQPPWSTHTHPAAVSLSRWWIPNQPNWYNEHNHDIDKLRKHNRQRKCDFQYWKIQYRWPFVCK